MAWRRGRAACRGILGRLSIGCELTSLPLDWGMSSVSPDTFWVVLFQGSPLQMVTHSLKLLKLKKF